eukprot:CAMPEP_0168402962 /NCGR_PEP_ID=MMETSP0228-20121227/23884_1 /TAXON_ID=133427 /ORGANISM="Protoceratium reticulatum, Strain CCCM 535 (=CCMP 1889)" /LENGTH=203 /DNA_ID=CAMNT_0008416551 /DNA_START=210 /DNA_END=822 /DNA_ORIENTATION=-
MEQDTPRGPLDPENAVADCLLAVLTPSRILTTASTAGTLREPPPPPPPPPAIREDAEGDGRLPLDDEPATGPEVLGRLRLQPRLGVWRLPEHGSQLVASRREAPDLLRRGGHLRQAAEVTVLLAAARVLDPEGHTPRMGELHLRLQPVDGRGRRVLAPVLVIEVIHAGLSGCIGPAMGTALALRWHSAEAGKALALRWPSTEA